MTRRRTRPDRCGSDPGETTPPIDWGRSLRLGIPANGGPTKPYRSSDQARRTAMMKALVYGGPGQRSWESVPLPDLKDPDDAIVRVDAVTICGTDLHILKGDVPEVEQGRILGHEAVGTIVEIGSGVRNLTVGARVLVSACGRCCYCRTGSYGQCLGGGGWILGHLIDRT